MGIQQITERAEVQKTAANHQTGFRVPDLAGAAAAGPASLGKALAGVADGVKGVGLALAKVDETDADAAVREIRKFSDHVLNVGYRDPATGVQQPGIATDDRIEMVRGSANRHDALVNDYARRLLDGANENVRRLVSEKTDEMRSNVTHSLRKREVLKEAKFQYDNLVSDIGERSGSLVDSQLMKSRTMRASPLEEYLAGNVAAAESAGELWDETSENRMLGQLSSVGTAFGADYAEGFEMMKREALSIRDGMATRLRNYCLHGERDAANKSEVAMRKTVSDVVDALVGDGDFGRARAYAQRLGELGFTEEQSSEAMRKIDAAERHEAARVEADVRKRREAVRDDFGRGLAEIYDPKSGVSDEEMPYRFAEICEKAAQEALVAGDPQAAARYRADARGALESARKAEDERRNQAARAEAAAARAKAKANDDAERAKAAAERAKAAAERAELDANDTELRYAEQALVLAAENGMESPERLAERQNALYSTATRLLLDRKIRPEDFASFRTRMGQLGDEDTARASAEFYRAFGFSHDVDGDGLLSSDERRRALKEGGKLYFPGTKGTDDERKVTMKEFFQMHDAFMSELRAMPPGERRSTAAKELLGRFRRGWYAKMFSGDIGRSVADEMLEARSRIQTGIDANAIKRREEYERRTMPVIDLRHPANAPKKEGDGGGDGDFDPLSFYTGFGMFN